MGGFSAAQTIIGAMITPAFPLMAAVSLISASMVRLARVVDRVRKLGESGARSVAELRVHYRRAMLAERAMQVLFMAVMCFVFDGFCIGADHFAGGTLTWLPVTITSLGMCLILAACFLMLQECRLSSRQICSEITGMINTRTKSASKT